MNFFFPLVVGLASVHLLPQIEQIRTFFCTSMWCAWTLALPFSLPLLPRRPRPRPRLLPPRSPSSSSPMCVVPTRIEVIHKLLTRSFHSNPPSPPTNIDRHHPLHNPTKRLFSPSPVQFFSCPVAAAAAADSVLLLLGFSLP